MLQRRNVLAVKSRRGGAMLSPVRSRGRHQATSRGATTVKTHRAPSAQTMERTLVALTLSLGAAADAQPYTFAISIGTQPSNVGTITLMLVNTTTVNVSVDLLSGSG